MIAILTIFLFLYHILIINASNCSLKNSRYITNNTADFDSLHFYSLHVVPKNYYAAKHCTVKGFMVAYCHNKYTRNPKKEYLLADVNGKKFKGYVRIMQYSFCRLTDVNCRLEIFYVDFNIPRKLLAGKESILIIDNGTNKKKKIKLSSEAANSKVFNGITVCTPTHYWYNNWLQMFTFLEYWRKQSNVHVVIHYRGLSSTVFKLINSYVDLGLVTLVPTPPLPKQKGRDIEQYIFGFGGKIYINSCMYSRNTKYVISMDSDEYIHFFRKKKTNLFDFVEREIARKPNLHSINFSNVRVSYTNRNITDNFKFAQKYYYYKDSINEFGKSVVRTSKIDMIGYHLPIGVVKSETYRIDKKVAVVLHARSNYVTVDIMKRKKKYPQAQLFNDKERLELVKHYNEIKENVMNGTLNFDYNVKIANSLKLTERVKTEKFICYIDYEDSKKYIGKLENWVYAEDQCDMKRIFVPF